MSKFSKKASDRSSGGSSNVDWDGFNDHLLEQIGEEEENRIAILSGLIDLGVQERPDYVEEYTGTKKQEAALKAGTSHLDEEEENIITPLKPTEQIAIMADFPEIMVNYGKFFSKDGEDDWKPYRHLITNEWWDKGAREKLAKGVSLSCKPDDKADSGWAYDRKSTISKLAVATGVVPKAPVDQNFDIGELLGGVFTMDVSAEEDGKYVNIKVKNISKKHDKIPVPDHDVVPFGVMLEGGNDEEDLKQIRASVKNTLKRAKGWETSGLKAELDALESSSSSSNTNTNANGQPDLDDMEDDEVFDLAEELGMKVTRKTAIADAVKFIEAHYAEDNSEEEEEEAPKKTSRKTSTKKSTKAKGNTKKASEDDEEDDKPPFEPDEEEEDDDDDVPY